MMIPGILARLSQPRFRRPLTTASRLQADMADLSWMRWGKVIGCPASLRSGFMPGSLPISLFLSGTSDLGESLTVSVSRRLGGCSFPPSFVQCHPALCALRSCLVLPSSWKSPSRQNHTADFQVDLGSVHSWAETADKHTRPPLSPTPCLPSTPFPSSPPPPLTSLTSIHFLLVMATILGCCWSF